MPGKGWIVGALLMTLAMAGAIPAGAAVPHTVGPGETLWSIAAANNFTTRSLAAYNGLSETSNVVLGTTIQIPSVPEGAAALARTGLGPAPVATGTPAPATVPVSTASASAS